MAPAENALWAYSPVMWRGSLLVTGSPGEILLKSNRSTLPVINGRDITLLLRWLGGFESKTVNLFFIYLLFF